MSIGRLTAHRASCPGRRSVPFVAALLGAAILLLRPHPAPAQVGLGTDVTTDATVAPAGNLRIRAFIQWTRYDALFGIPDSTGLRPMGSLFSSSALGTNQVPLLTGAQTDVRALTGTAGTTISLGQLTTAANARVMTAPILLEYGLTRRLTLGVAIPLAQTRANVVTQLNPKGSTSATVGPNPTAFFNNATAYAANAQVTSSLQAAAQQLGAQLAACQANPGGAGCGTILSQQGQVGALVALSAGFATTAGALYGVSTSQPGQPFIPIANGALEKAIDARLDSIQAAFAAYGVNAGTGALTAAGGPAAYLQLQRLVSDPSFGIARDTLGTAAHFSLGDIEVAATYQLANSFTDTTPPGWQERIALRAGARLPTGQPAELNRVYDIGSGSGQLAAEGAAVVDLKQGARWLTTIAAQATLPLGTLDVGRTPYAGGALLPLLAPEPGTLKAGMTAEVDLLPRFRLTPFWMITGQYTLLRQAADQITVDDTAGTVEPFGGRSAATEQLLGFGFTYSTIGLRGGAWAALPMEISLSHLEGVGGSGGPVPKYFRDQIELRIYLPARR